MAPLVKQPHEHEQGARGNAVAQHLVDRAIQAHLCKREDPQDDKAEVAHRRVRHQLLHVGLHHGHQRAVNDPDDRQHHDPGRAGSRRGGKQRQAEVQESVGAHLQHHGSQHHGARHGGFHVRVRQPGVQGEDGNFDGEGREKRQEEQQLLAGSERKPAVRDHVHKGRVAEGLRAIVEVDDGRQHQHRAGHGEQEKLHRRVDAALMAPDADEEVHGHQRDFPEHVEQKQVLRQEHAHQPEFEQQQKREELFHTALDGAP